MAHVAVSVKCKRSDFIMLLARMGYAENLYLLAPTNHAYRVYQKSFPRPLSVWGCFTRPHCRNSRRGQCKTTVYTVS